MEKVRFLNKAEREQLKANEKQEKLKNQQKAYFSKSIDDVKTEDQPVTKTLNSESKEKRKRNNKKFVFDWAEDDDTSQPLDYENIKSIGFGRRTLAGLDEQATRIKRQKSRFDERHWSIKTLDEMTQRDWRIFREDFNISTKGGKVPNPIRKWSEANVPFDMLQVIEKVGYTDPTPIQRQAIPIQLENRDLIGIAETGSGKTASFVIPMLVFITQLPPITFDNAALGPYGLILAPTRELAQQIELEATKFAQSMGFICVSLVGGHTLEQQSVRLRNGVHIVIATPGRLRDAIDRRFLSLGQCTYVVMDEADRMFEMKIDDDLRFILDSMPLTNMKPNTEDAQDIARLKKITKRSLPFRQTVMFSATMPPEVEKLALQYLRSPVTVLIGNVGQAVDTIEQRIEMIEDEGRRITRLVRILSSGDYEPPIIVFVREKKDCENLKKSLDKYGFKTVTLHSGKSQDQREASLLSFKEKRKDVLIATDVAGRGIDVKNVSLVVNFHMAKSVEAYTHRIGRTGRAGKTGVAITFLGNSDSDVFYDLKVMLQKAKNSHLPSEFLRHEGSQKKFEEKISK